MIDIAYEGEPVHEVTAYPDLGRLGEVGWDLLLFNAKVLEDVLCDRFLPPGVVHRARWGGDSVVAVTGRRINASQWDS